MEEPTTRRELRLLMEEWRALGWSDGFEAGRDFERAQRLKERPPSSPSGSTPSNCSPRQGTDVPEETVQAGVRPAVLCSICLRPVHANDVNLRGQCRECGAYLAWAEGECTR